MKTCLRCNQENKTKYGICGACIDGLKTDIAYHETRIRELKAILRHDGVDVGGKVYVSPPGPESDIHFAPTDLSTLETHHRDTFDQKIVPASTTRCVDCGDITAVIDEGKLVALGWHQDNPGMEWVCPECVGGLCRAYESVAAISKKHTPELKGESNGK